MEQPDDDRAPEGVKLVGFSVMLTFEDSAEKWEAETQRLGFSRRVRGQSWTTSVVALPPTLAVDTPFLGVVVYPADESRVSIVFNRERMPSSSAPSAFVEQSRKVGGVVGVTEAVVRLLPSASIHAMVDALLEVPAAQLGAAIPKPPKLPVLKIGTAELKPGISVLEWSTEQSGESLRSLTVRWSGNEVLVQAELETSVVPDNAMLEAIEKSVWSNLRHIFAQKTTKKPSRSKS